MRLPLLPVAPRRKIFTTAGPLPFFVPFVVPWVSPHWFFSPASCRCPHCATLAGTLRQWTGPCARRSWWPGGDCFISPEERGPSGEIQRLAQLDCPGH